VGYRLRTFEVGTAAAAGTVLAVALWLTGELPNPTVLVACAALIIVAENSAVLFSSSAGASPTFTVIMASVALFDDGTSIAGAALVGVSGGVLFGLIRSRRYGTVLFNAGQYVLASAAAAAVYTALPVSSGPAQTLAAVAAAIVFGAINTGLVIPELSMMYGRRPAVIWADLLPAMPNYLAFGMVGLLVGQLGASLGTSAIVLIALPMVIGRSTFASLIRLRDAHESTIGIFIRLIEAKDPYTAGHTERVAKFSQCMAEELGVAPSRYEHLRHSALMHDVGKLAVPNRLLNKPGRLTPEEFDVVRRHNDVCVDILGRVDFMKDMAVVASDRHGRFEASDAGNDDDLVVEAHIVAVADAFDAMTSTRSYRQALDHDVAIDELRRNAGTQFNPDCVEALVRALDRRGERYGRGHETDTHDFAVTPPEAGVGSAGLGDLEHPDAATGSGSP
jgi:hypothetical protein